MSGQSCGTDSMEKIPIYVKMIFYSVRSSLTVFSNLWHMHNGHKGTKKSKTIEPSHLQRLWSDNQFYTSHSDEILADFHAKMSLTLISHGKFLNQKDWSRSKGETPVMDFKYKGVPCSPFVARLQHPWHPPGDAMYVMTQFKNSAPLQQRWWSKRSSLECIGVTFHVLNRCLVWSLEYNSASGKRGVHYELLINSMGV